MDKLKQHETVDIVKASKKKAIIPSPENAPAQVKKRGRPTKYREEFIDMMLAYFDQPPVIREQYTVIDKNGRPEIRYKEHANILPTQQGFCALIGIDDSQFKRWLDIKPFFRATWDKCKEKQQHNWITASLMGYYNPTFSIFFGKNVYGWKDKTEIEHKVGPTLEKYRELSDDDLLAEAKIKAK